MKDSFGSLIHLIQETHHQLQDYAVRSVNMSLTIRNWLIGYYIVEYEQNGEDRAKYGTALIDNIAQKVSDIKGLDVRSLRRFRTFYNAYPQLQKVIWGTVSPELDLIEKEPFLLEIKKRGTVSPELNTDPSADKRTHYFSLLLQKLSYSHLDLLIGIGDEMKRTFYEIECIKGTWSVRELKRQINSLYYERSGLSRQPERMSELLKNSIRPQSPKDVIKDIYTFEFLDLPIREVIEESDFEKALLDNLQGFLLELGNGFCFEARQKRLLIGQQYYFADLVFYHRILQCHILIELKIGAFQHGDIAQLNTYLNYYKAEISEPKDNDPIGILLVAEKDNALVKYATAGMDENIFIQQYLINLPDNKILKEYMEQEIKRLS